MQSAPRGVVTAPADVDPAMLAFVKCHVTSFAKWDVLRVLADRAGFWSSADELAIPLHHPVARVRDTLDELVVEGIIERMIASGQPRFRLAPDEMSSIVVRRLIASASSSQDLRLILVANILNRG